ncbi:MAG: hypothetical protein CL975_03975 [Euryarchaeota archaeon]|nr:hypothetical protein [Euryarchaeota archaeon]
MGLKAVVGAAVCTKSANGNRFRIFQCEINNLFKIHNQDKLYDQYKIHVQYLSSDDWVGTVVTI